jgi:TonB family protein
MNTLFTYLLESCLCLAVLLAFYKIFLSNQTFFGWNRAYLLLALLGSLVFPLLSLPIITLTDKGLFHLPELMFPGFELIGSQNQPTATPGFSWTDGIMLIYFVGVLVSLVRLIWGCTSLYSKTLKGEKIRKGDLSLYVHPTFEASSFFNHIFLPEYESHNPDHQCIIAHEAAHGRYYHSLDLLVIQVAKIILWFYPILNAFERALVGVHEYQVDQKMIQKLPKATYAGLLIKLLRTDVKANTVIHHFNQFQIKKRLIMMNRPNSRWLALSKYVLAFPLFGLLFVFIACEEQEDLLTLKQKNTEDISGVITKGEVFDVVEEMPTPSGGMEGWNKYLSENLVYPAAARADSVEGTVYAEFVVNKDGEVQDVGILRGIDPRINQAALDVIRNSPNWNPGQQKGEKVDVKLRIPIRFKLN